MTPERWQQIRAVFTSVLDVPSSERQGRVEALCPNDPTLRDEVLRLLALSDEGATFLERPAARLLPDPPAPPPPLLLAVGDIVANRFRIVRFLGRGGMGEVYEAEDDVLHDHIALKVMHDVGDGTEVAARLRREVQMARRVSHPGVCRVHDVACQRMHDGAERIVLTMELLAGETLAERLRRGPLSTGEALDLARQIASALDAAHAERILHRDIKPGNILLVRRNDGTTRAVVTDFGLARGLEQGPASAAVTRAGAFIGTPEYMAPEQLRGETPTIESDVYAFGLVLYEMVTGKRPYPPNAPWARLVNAPPSVGTLVPGLAPGWTDALSRALLPDPSRRAGSAGDIVRTIEHGRTGWRRRFKTFALAAGVALLLVALIVAGRRFYVQSPPTVPPASQVLLTDTINGTGDEDFDGATEVLRSQLMQSPHFETIAPPRVREVLQQMHRTSTGPLEPEVAREVAMREGARLVVYSTLTRLGPEYVLSVRLERVGARPTLIRATWNQTFTAGSKREVFDKFRDAAVWTRRLTGENPADLADQDRPPSDTTTSSWEALRLFAKANTLHAAGQLSEAALLFEDAIRRDPQFAMAQMRLAEVLISLKRDAEAYDAWRHALRLLETHQVSSRESLRVKGQYLEDTGDLPGAEKAFRSYALHYPNDHNAAFFLGSVLHDLGRAAEAVPWLEKASELRPAALAAPVHLATAHIELGQRDRAANTVAVLRRYGQEDWARWIEALALFAQSEVAMALDAIEPLRTSSDPQWRSRASLLRASWLTEAGRLQEAADTLRQGIQHDAAQGFRQREADKWLHLAEILRRAGDRAGSEDALARGVASAPTPVQIMMAGTIWMRANRIDEAERLLALIDDRSEIARVKRARARLSAEILLARGRAHDAAQMLDTAMSSAPQRESRLTLARALMRTGDAARADQLLLAMVSRPSLAYSAPEPEWPGLWTDGLLEYATFLDGAKRPEASRFWSLYRQVQAGTEGADQ